MKNHLAMMLVLAVLLSACTQASKQANTIKTDAVKIDKTVNQQRSVSCKETDAGEEQHTKLSPYYTSSQSKNTSDTAFPMQSPLFGPTQDKKAFSGAIAKKPSKVIIHSVNLVDEPTPEIKRDIRKRAEHARDWLVSLGLDKALVSISTHDRSTPVCLLPAQASHFATSYNVIISFYDKQASAKE